MALVRMDGRARASEKAAEAICSSFDFVQVACVCGTSQRVHCGYYIAPCPSSGLWNYMYMYGVWIV